MSRCLILGCSEAKRDESQALAAIERYDGPTFLVLRKFLSEAASELQDVEVYVLSARHGLIAGNRAIDDYDQKMTKARASTVRPRILKDLRKVFAKGYDEVFVSLSQLYLRAIGGFERLVPDGTRIIVSQAAMGRRLTELKLWLYQLSEDDIASERQGAEVRVTGRATLRGQEIEATAEEVTVLGQKALADGWGTPDNFRSWYALIDGQRVSTKWLVSLLSGLDVSQFQASEGRRVLRQLGIEVYHDD